MTELTDLANQLERLRSQFLVSVIGGVLFSTPEIRQRINTSFGWHGQRAMKNMWIRRISHPPYVLDIGSVANQPASDRAPWDVVEPWVGVLMLTLGDGLKRLGLAPTPLFEFARHVRNAVAHGGTFDIRHERGPAHFDGIEITRTDNGRPLYDVVSPGDLLALYDRVIDALRTHQSIDK